MLVLRLAEDEPGSVAVDDEPARAAGGVGEDRVEVGDTAVADPLLLAGDPVRRDGAGVVGDRHGDGLHRTEVASRLRLGGAIGHQQALAGDPSQPASLLVRCASDHDRVAAQERRQDRRGHAEVDAGHPLTGSVHVEGRTAHAAVLLGDEQQLDAEVVAAHPLDQLGRELVTFVQVDQQLFGELVSGELADRVERHLQHVSIKASHVSVLLAHGCQPIVRPAVRRPIETIDP